MSDNYNQNHKNQNDKNRQQQNNSNPNQKNPNREYGYEKKHDNLNDPDNQTR